MQRYWFGWKCSRVNRRKFVASHCATGPKWSSEIQPLGKMSVAAPMLWHYIALAREAHINSPFGIKQNSLAQSWNWTSLGAPFWIPGGSIWPNCPWFPGHQASTTSIIFARELSKIRKTKPQSLANGWPWRRQIPESQAVIASHSRCVVKM